MTALERADIARRAALPAPGRAVTGPQPAPETPAQPQRLRRIELTFRDEAARAAIMRALRKRAVGSSSFVGTWDDGVELSHRGDVLEVIIHRPSRSARRDDSSTLKRGNHG